MKKYQFRLTRELMEKATRPIRNKHDIIELLLYSIKLFLTDQICIDPPSNEKLIIYIDKMSRLVFCVEHKIFSFQFPFTLKPVELDPQHVTISYSSYYQIDNITSSLLLAIFNRPDIFDSNLETIYYMVEDEIKENEWEGINTDFINEIVMHLMLFEPGYLRYDHDKEHEKGALHPEHHIDFYFSSNNAMKLGLEKGIHEEWLLDMLDVLTDCKYIQ